MRRSSLHLPALWMGRSQTGSIHTGNCGSRKNSAVAPEQAPAFRMGGGAPEQRSSRTCSPWSTFVGRLAMKTLPQPVSLAN